MSQLSASGGQSIGGSASALVLPMNIQSWFPLGLTGWISLQSKGLSRVFSNTTVQKYPFFLLSLLYSPTLMSVHDYWKTQSFDFTYFCQQSDVSAFNMLSRFVIALLPRSKVLFSSLHNNVRNAPGPNTLDKAQHWEHFTQEEEPMANGPSNHNYIYIPSLLTLLPPSHPSRSSRAPGWPPCVI